MLYAKAIAAAVAAVLGAVIPALYVAGPLTVADWINVLILACGAIHVYNASNLAHWDYAKCIAAVVSTAAVAISSALSDGAVTRVEWIQVAVAALGAFAVYRIPNAQRPGRHEAPEAPNDDRPRPYP